MQVCRAEPQPVLVYDPKPHKRPDPDMDAGVIHMLTPGKREVPAVICGEVKRGHRGSVNGLKVQVCSAEPQPALVSVHNIVDCSISCNGDYCNRPEDNKQPNVQPVQFHVVFPSYLKDNPKAERCAGSA